MKEPWISTRNFAKLLSEYLPLVGSVCFPVKIKCGQFNSFYLKLLETFWHQCSLSQLITMSGVIGQTRNVLPLFRTSFTWRFKSDYLYKLSSQSVSSSRCVCCGISCLKQRSILCKISDPKMSSVLRYSTSSEVYPPVRDNLNDIWFERDIR